MASKRTGRVKHFLSQNTLEAKVTEKSNLDMWEYPTFDNYNIAELSDYQQDCKRHAKKNRTWIRRGTELCEWNGGKLYGDQKVSKQAEATRKLRHGKNKIQIANREAKRW